MGFERKMKQTVNIIKSYSYLKSSQQYNIINNIAPQNSYLSELIENSRGSYVYVFKEGSTTDLPVDFVLLFCGKNIERVSSVRYDQVVSF